jgi:protoporphyrinogen/coproporphyrinogen III oxidase
VLPTRVWPFATTRLFSPLEKLRMAGDLVRPRCIAPADEAIGAFLRRRLGNAVVDRLAGPLIGGIYGTPIDELSIDAVVPQLRTYEREHRSLLFAGLAQGRAMRASHGNGRGSGASPGASPGASAERSPGVSGPRSSAAPMGAPGDRVRRPPGMFASLAGGMQQLPDALEASLAGMAGTVSVRTGVEVRALERLGTGAIAVLSDGTRVRADAVILATPGAVTARLLEPELPAAAGPVDAIPHGSSLTVTLAYREEQIRTMPVGHGFLVPAAEGAAIMACTWSSRKWDDRAPSGTILMRAFFPDTPTTRDAADDDVLALARRDVGRVLGIVGAPVLERVVRMAASMPRYTVGHLARVAAAEAACAEWPAIVLAGAPYHGVGLPDCVSQGRAAAGSVLARLGSVPATA